MTGGRNRRQRVARGGSRWISTTVLLLIIVILAITTRSLPLSFSQYPYNNDSLIETGMAAEILETGHLRFSHDSPWFGTHSTATPALNILLSFASSAIGVSPLGFAQFLTAALAVVTLCIIFLLAWTIIGDPKGALVAVLAAAFFGTFLFTTGSSWKAALGIAMLSFLFFSYIKRADPRYRILVIVILMIMPTVHHQVAAVAYLAVAYLCVWSWVFAAANSSMSRRNYLDTLTVVPPIVIALAYYMVTLGDRFEIISSPVSIALFGSSFIFLALISSFVLLLRSHVKWSFAPAVAVGIVIGLLLSTSIFSYTSSASEVYVVLIIATGVVVGFAWHGAETIIERRPLYRAVLLAMLMAPLTVILFGMGLGSGALSNQIFYRSFDYADFFIFVGLGASASVFSSRKTIIESSVVPAIVVALLVTLPFGYYTADLLGVRHDTAAYEVDAVRWLGAHADSPVVVSDERIGRIAYSTIWVEKHAYLPHDLVTGEPLQRSMFYILEGSWTTVGVNDYPYGRAVIPQSVIDSVFASSNLLYIGGPRSDMLSMYLPEW